MNTPAASRGGVHCDAGLIRPAFVNRYVFGKCRGEMSFGANMLSVGILGLFVSAALGTGVVVVRHEVRAFGGDEDRVLDLCFWLLIGAIIGARLFDVAQRSAGLAADPLEIFRFWNGSSFYFGGAAAAVAAGAIFIKRNRLPLWKTTDLFGPALAIGHFLVYFGLFFSGQSPNESFGFIPNLVIARPGDGLLGSLPRPNPVALYLACGSFFIFAILLIVKKRRRFDGQVFWTFTLLNGGLQLGPTVSDFSGSRLLNGGELSPGTVINALIIAISLAMLIILNRRVRQAAQWLN
jgi:phosphatidylglycerol:prolipoprotein diacylglycerol transferase